MTVVPARDDRTYETLTVTRDGPVLLIGLNRPDKRNAFNAKMLGEYASALGELDTDPTLLAGVLFANGPAFTAGLDLADVASAIQSGTLKHPEGGIDGAQLSGRRLSKPLVAAVHGKCFTLGIELMLTADIVVAAESTRFAQLEITRGLFAFGGATIRFPAVSGWGNAMRWMLTAEEFDATEGLRIGLVQEVVPDDSHLVRACELAHVIARQAPLGVQATLRNARIAIRDGERAAEAELGPTTRQLFGTEDAQRGLQAFLTREPAEFVGR